MKCICDEFFVMDIETNTVYREVTHAGTGELDKNGVILLWKMF